MLQTEPRWWIQFISFFTALNDLHMRGNTSVVSVAASGETSPAQIDRTTIYIVLMLRFYSVGQYSAIHLSTQALKGLGGCLLDLTKDPEILHKLLCLVKSRLKNTQRSARRSTQNSLPAT